MFKKVLVIVCAMSVMVMTGCGMLGGVSQKDYEMATADRDMYTKSSFRNKLLSR